MDFLITYLNIFEIINFCSMKVINKIFNDRIVKREQSIAITDEDIFIIKKNEEVIDIIYWDKYFEEMVTSIIYEKEDSKNKNEYTKSFRCYIINYEKIVEKIPYNEFCVRYKGNSGRIFMESINEEYTNIESFDEEKESYSDDDLYNINSWGADLSFRELILMYKDDELLKPELQRKYVWTKNEASRFIDSILLGLPVPSIFLAKTSNEKRLIVDGYQRIMTVYDYVEGIFGGDGKTFKLSNSEIINKKWRGKSFLELDSDQRTKIKTTTIHAIIFEQKHPNNDTGMYQIFERINTSGKILKPQEIRNCVYSGKFNELLMNLNKEKVWRDILKSEKEDARMADVELLLRFFAMSSIKDSEEISQNQINLTKYLNKYMGKNRNISDEKYEELKSIFINVMNSILVQLGDKAFRNITMQEENITFTKRVHPVIFDAVCSAAIYVLKNGINIENIANIEERYIDLLKNEEFKDAISVRTTNIKNIKKRISLAAQYLYGVKYEW